MAGMTIYLAERRVRLFQRRDRPSRFWQAAFRLPGRARPLVKSTGQVDLAAAKRWALDLLALLHGAEPVPATSSLLSAREDLLAPYPFPHIRQKKRQVEREIALRTLNAYQRNPLIAQRHLALELNVSLAIVNAYTTRCVRSGWLLKLHRPAARGRGYRYVLTESGQRQLRDLLANYIGEELTLFRALREDFMVMLAESGDRPVILQGGGDLAAVARLVLADAGRKPLLEIPPNPGNIRQVLRRHRDAIVWLTDPADSVMDPTLPVVVPALLRKFGYGRHSPVATRVSSKTKV